MTIIAWSEQYRINVRSLDQQHRHLFEIINALDNISARESGEKEAIGQIIAELRNYVEYHFAAEERLMQAVRFPGYETHKTAHDHLRQEVVKFAKQFEDNEVPPPANMLAFLVGEWLVDHILDMDQKLANCMEKQQ